MPRKTCRLLPVLVLLLALCHTAPARDRTGDFDKDGRVTTDDMFVFATYYRLRETDSPKALRADLNGDGKVNELDLFQFLQEWQLDREPETE